jgi:NodT family efflux transporter outer membrane factor (OMF) lipoprotein
MDVGTGWKQAQSTEVAPSSTWWTQFSSTSLDALIAQALQHNNDLQAALQRVAQTRASVKIASASLWPQVTASSSAARTRQDRHNGAALTTDSYRGQVGVAYEIDLFGRNRAAQEAARAQLEASRFDHDALAIIIAAEVARAYAGAVATSARLRVAEDNLTIAREVLAIIQARFDAGRTSALELSQQKAVLVSTEATIASLHREHDAFVNQLAVLIGQAPQNFTLQEHALSTMTVPAIAPTVPSRLLEQRPDIRSAEAELIAAHADIGAARAAFFPSLEIGLDSALTGNPYAMLSTLAASALAPIFQGGALKGELERSQARKEELVATYRQTVLTTFQEVSDALSAAQAAVTRVNALDTAAQASRQAYTIARERYAAGAIDFQALLDTQRSLLQAEDAFTLAQLEHIQAAIDLYKALGGGWNI